MPDLGGAAAIPEDAVAASDAAAAIPEDAAAGASSAMFMSWVSALNGKQGYTGFFMQIM